MWTGQGRKRRQRDSLWLVRGGRRDGPKGGGRSPGAFSSEARQSPAPAACTCVTDPAQVEAFTRPPPSLTPRTPSLSASPPGRRRGTFFQHPAPPQRPAIRRVQGAGRVPDTQSRLILYSLPRRRCYAQHGVDRPASRHAGLHSASTSLPCSMEVQPCPCHLRPVIRLRH